MATYRTRTARDGSTSVHVQVRMTGYPARTETFATKREAQKWAATVEAEMIEGRHFKDAAGRKRTLSEVIKRFRLEVLPLKKNGSMYGFTLDWWDSNHGTKKLGEVSRGWLADARTQLLTGTFRRSTPGSKRSMFKLTHGLDAHPPVPKAVIQGNRYDHAQDYSTPREFQRTPATANRYMAALSAVFSQVCGNWEWLQPGANPFTGLGKLPEGKNKGKAYADEARAKLLQAAAADPQLHRLVRVALGTAARAGELIGLTWSHVELGDTEGRLMFEDTKNGESRIAWLYGDALAAMKEQRAERYPAIGNGVVDAVIVAAYLNAPVFPGQWSHKAQRYGRYDYLPRLHAALAAAGLTMKRPFHALRHTAATELARMGANAHQLKAIGGWKSDAVNTYVHMAAQDTKALSQALAIKLSSREAKS